MLQFMIKVAKPFSYNKTFVPTLVPLSFKFFTKFHVVFSIEKVLQVCLNGNALLTKDDHHTYIW